MCKCDIIMKSHANLYQIYIIIILLKLDDGTSADIYFIFMGFLGSSTDYNS